VELTFRSQSLHSGVEFLSETGHRTEYIDVTSGRRREDYSSNVTAMGQSTSIQSLVWIFDGTNFYVSVDKQGKRANRVMEIRVGYDYTIWGDAAVEELKIPGATAARRSFWGGFARSTRFRKAVKPSDGGCGTG